MKSLFSPQKSSLVRQFLARGEGGGGSRAAAGQIFLEFFSAFLFSFQSVVRRCSDLGCDQYLAVVILN